MLMMDTLREDIEINDVVEEDEDSSEDVELDWDDDESVPQGWAVNTFDIKIEDFAGT